jgi:hypothetical protein
MSTFTAHLNTISPDTFASSASETHNNPHAVPTAVDTAALFRLLQDQFATLSADAPNATNRNLLRALAESLEEDIAHPPTQLRGVPQSFLDGLERVPKKQLGRGPDDTCPICADGWWHDGFPLVVELPCKGRHRFDLECVGPWLLAQGTCPMCRADFGAKSREEREREERKKREAAKEGDSEGEEEEDEMGMFG